MEEERAQTYYSDVEYSGGKRCF